MKKIAVASAALLALGLLAPSAHAATASSAPAVAATAKSDYSKKKQNRFWRVVKSVEPSVSYAGKRSTVDLGIGVCDYLRSGGNLYGLAAMVVGSDAGVAEDAVIAVIATAPVVLCRDQQYKFE